MSSKIIYEGVPNDFFNAFSFNNYLMKELGGEKVIREDRAYGFTEVYHLVPYSVSTKMGFRGIEPKIWVELFGKEKDIGKVEKIILEEAKKQEANS